MACGGPSSLWGWSPPPLPADTPLRARMERLWPWTGLPAVLYYAAVIVALRLAPHLPLRGDLVLDAWAALAAGAWCGLNFWRCRHAHCAVAGAGWLGLALLAGVETVLGRSLIGGDEQPVFLGVLTVALAFEGAWYLVRGSHALSPVRAPRA